jgi:hypothetical protein
MSGGLHSRPATAVVGHRLCGTKWLRCHCLWRETAVCGEIGSAVYAITTEFWVLDLQCPFYLLVSDSDSGGAPSAA